QAQVSSSAMISQQEHMQQGELYAGFVLLSAVDSLQPSFVQCAPAPILHGDKQVDPAYRGETVKFTSVDALVDHIDFPIYIPLPSSLPLNVRQLGGSILRFAMSKEIFMATLNYGDQDAGQSLIEVRARPIYPRPYPVRPVHHSTNYEKELLPPKTVNFTPSPGIIQKNALGHEVQWIEQDILYGLIVNYDSSRRAAEDVARSLV